MSHGSQYGNGSLSGLPPYTHGSTEAVSFDQIVLTIASDFNNAAADSADKAIAGALARIAGYSGASCIQVLLYDWDNNTATVRNVWQDAPQCCPQTGILPFSGIPKPLLRQHRAGEAVFTTVCSHPAHSVPALSIPLMAQGDAVGACVVSGMPGTKRRRHVLQPHLTLFCALLTGFLMRIQSEQALSENQQSFRLLLDSTHDAVSMLDRESIILCINDQMAKRFGKKPDELIGTCFKELVPAAKYGDLLEQRERVFRAVFDTKTPAFFEDTRGGRWYDNRFYPVFKGKKVVAVTIFSTDITDRKELESEKSARLAQQIQSEEQLKKDSEYIDILNSAAQGGYVVDFENRQVRCSREWIGHLGLEDVPQEQLLTAFFNRLSPTDSAVMSQWLTQAQARQLPRYSTDFQIRGSGGKMLCVLAQGRLIYNDAGRLIKTYGSFIDITLRRRMEMALRRQSNKLRQKNRLISNFFMNVSDEFRTPLSVLLMMLDMMELHLADIGCEYAKGLKKATGEMRLNVYRLLHLVGNILDITKIDARFDKPNLVAVDVVALTGDVVDAVQSHVQNTGVRITFSSDQPARIIPADTEKLIKILLNLLSNAVRHSPPGKSVAVSLRNAPESLLICVKDEGEGIPSDMIGVIFDRFRRAGTLTHAQQGCGIGLSLTKGLAELLGGRICVESRAGFGSRFFVELPVLPAPSEPAPFAQEGLTLAQRVEIAFADVRLEQ